MGKLFGTDGVRGVANTELTGRLALELGRAACFVLLKELHHRPKIIIGKDTRISSDMLESAMAAGFCSMGADVVLLGTVPTPAVAFLVKEMGADAGVMISASHNPFQDNGIKIFQGDGYKLSDSIEEEIEDILLNDKPLPQKSGSELGRIHPDSGSIGRYVAHIVSTIHTPLKGLKIALDCANGSASATAKEIFTASGAQVLTLCDRPDGTNINDSCGSTHIEALCAFVPANGCDAGFAFDGDADRCLAVDEKGRVVDGDQIIAMLARHFKQEGRLRNNAAVVTVMSNLGFSKFARENGIDVVSTRVGDRYVLEEMLKGSYCIGGEQSGHVICLDYATTGDGQLTAIQLLELLRLSGKPLSLLASAMEVYPQLIKNIRVSSEGKALLAGNAAIGEAIAGAEKELGAEGRVLVRPSGTEPLVRVMLEGKSIEQITRLAENIAMVIQNSLPSCP